MTNAATPSALAIAGAYHEAWTGGDLDRAMRYVADDIICNAPGQRLQGIAQYRAFIGGFMANLTGIVNLAAFGDETTAVLYYYPQTAVVADAPAAECFTVSAGKITRSELVFDRLSYAPPQTQ